MNNIKKAIRQINAGLSKLNVPTHVLSFVSIDETVPQQTLLVNMGFMYGQAGESVVIGCKLIPETTFKRGYNE